MNAIEQGRALRRLRLLKGIKQSHLAELLGVDQASISRWERGSAPLGQERWLAAGTDLRDPSRRSVPLD